MRISRTPGPTTGIGFQSDGSRPTLDLVEFIACSLSSILREGPHVLSRASHPQHGLHDRTLYTSSCIDWSSSPTLTLHSLEPDRSWCAPLPSGLPQSGGPADADQRLIGVGEGELVHAPRLVLGPAAHACRQLVDLFHVEVETERIPSRHEPVLHRRIQPSDSMR